VRGCEALGMRDTDNGKTGDDTMVWGESCSDEMRRCQPAHCGDEFDRAAAAIRRLRSACCALVPDGWYREWAPPWSYHCASCSLRSSVIARSLSLSHSRPSRGSSSPLAVGVSIVCLMAIILTTGTTRAERTQQAECTYHRDAHRREDCHTRASAPIELTGRTSHKHTARAASICGERSNLDHSNDV
jgi:hypothetical protein